MQDAVFLRWPTTKSKAIRVDLTQTTGIASRLFIPGVDANL
jgi:hypothetical protein